MSGRNDEPNWRSAAGGTTPRAQKHGWQQDDPQTQIKSGSRRFKMLFLIGGGIASAVAIVWLILLLIPGKRTGFIAIAADPREGITRLDIPYDPFGWLSANRMLSWLSEAGKKDERVPKVLSETPLWLDDQFDEWIEKIAGDESVNPVIIYVGLHGGVNADGDPILFTGRDAPSPVRESNQPAVQVGKILEKLKEKASNKQKILLLDVGRDLPDPNRGEISNDFSRAVRTKLGSAISQDPTLTVILAGADGQRAWDSSFDGVTAMSYSLLQSLSNQRDGSVGKANMESYRADELFEALRSDVLNWSKNNRPTSQELQMIPAIEDWQADAARREKYSARLFFKPRAGIPYPSDFLANGSPEITTSLKDEWTAIEQLAQRIPSPATYTPLAWRRYRELVLRFERAVLAGDADGAGALKNAMRSTRDDIERGLDLTLTSKDSIIPLSASLGRPISRSIDEITTAADLSAAANRTKALLGSASRPVEAHLPIMLDHYVRSVLNSNTDGVLKEIWKDAVKTRLLAERAVLGIQPSATSFPFSERVAPFVAQAIRDGDVARRRGEDRLHGSENDIATAAADFQQATSRYTEALAQTSKPQAALQLHHDTLAELPFISHWLVEADEKGSTSREIEQANSELRQLWTDTHKLDTLIANFPKDPASLSKTVDDVSKRITLLKELVSDRAQTSATADASSNWQMIEHLLRLPPPLIDSDNRARLITSAQRIAEKLAKTPTVFSGEITNDPKKVIRRMHALADSLGGVWKNWTDSRADLLKLDATLTETDANLYEKTPRSAAGFAAHLRLLADFPGYPDGGPTERHQSELFSRLAIPFQQYPVPEPAVMNARRLWKSLLEFEAHRIALDHWYNEQGQSYSTVVAGTFLKDAATIGELLGEPDAAKSADVSETQTLLGVPPLKLECIDANSSPIRWTTESDRILRYQLKTTPYRVPGLGVLFWTSETPALLELNVVGRRLVDLKQSISAGELQVTVRAGQQIEEAASQTRTTRIYARGYFRGQLNDLKQTTDVSINRKPDLVVTNIKPTRQAVVALRTDPEFSPGAVSILLDYSGSMTYGWEGKESKEKRNNEKSKSKKTAMISVLERLLDQELPRSTDLKIQAFLAREKTASDRIDSETIYDFEKANENFKNTFDRSGGLIEQLGKKKAEGNTPLLSSMRETIDAMKRDYRGNRTLIVLTDGADTTFHEKLFGSYKPVSDQYDDNGKLELKGMTDAEKRQLVEAVHKELPQFAREEDLLIQIIIFGKDEEEKKLALRMFEPIKFFERTPGNVIIADTEEELLKQLAQAIRPKPRLLYRNGSTIPNNVQERIYIPPSGIPTNTTLQGPGQFSWHGFLRPDAYQLRHYRTKQEVDLGMGDAMSIRLRRDRRGQSFFHRELYYKHVDTSLSSERIDDTHPDWYLSVPDFSYRVPNEHFLHLTTALESKIGTTATDDSNADEESRTTITPIKPVLVWWELTRVVGGKEERFPGTVSIHNLEGQPAPSWSILGNYGSKSDGLDTNQFRIRAWPRQSNIPNYAERILRPTAAELQSGITERIQDVTIRARIETIPFVPDHSINERLPKEILGKPQLVLVVRVDDPLGRRFQVQIDRKLDPAIAEHRYFYDKEDASATPKILSYTAVFGVLNPDSLARLGGIEMSLISITDLVASPEPRHKPLTATMRNPQQHRSFVNPFVEPVLAPKN